MVNAQEGKTVSFQNRAIELQSVTEFTDYLNENKRAHFAAWVSLKQTPTKEQRNQLKSQGLEIVQFIDGKTYLAKISKNSFSAQDWLTGFKEITADLRVDPELWNENINPESYVRNKVRLLCEIMPGFTAAETIALLGSYPVDVKQPNLDYEYLEVDVPENLVRDIFSLPNFLYVEAWNGPGTPDDRPGRSLHRANGLDTQMPNGRNYTGEGIGLLVRDDGIVGPHIDFQGRIDNTLASGVGGTHGDGVAGISSGAGNLDPRMRGMAAGTNVFVSNYASSFTDNATTSRINSGEVLITNSSYSDGCNAGYTGVTRRVDEQSLDFPNLLHVFSAGNSNNNDCGYGAGNQWGNITGGHKQGKNVIATANVFYQGTIVGSSSRGPAYDGRIKPDIAANGQSQMSTDENNEYMSFGGTSGAAPGIAGIAAQLYEAYQLANNDELPTGALIKATMLNTANDYGNPGPDFKFGWGIVNATRAAKLIEDNRFLADTVAHQDTNTHLISVGSNVKEVRFMLYWHDIEAAIANTKALVNDLDLKVIDPSTGEHLPWVLDPTANATTLDQDATTGADHLNNMEQVLISVPAAGAYEIQVSGFDIPVGPQGYYIVWEVIEEEVEVTFPNLGQSLVPGTTETIFWDATGMTGNVGIEYSTDNGSTWNFIDSVAADRRYEDWQVPSVLTGNALIRIGRGNVSDVSDSVFSIAPEVTGLALDTVCPDRMVFTWDADPNAEEYDVYRLGTKYMEIIGTSSATSVEVPISNPFEEVWYAIRSRNTTDNWTSLRTIANYYEGGIKNCVMANDIELVQINQGPNDFSPVCSSDSTVSLIVKNAGTQTHGTFDLAFRVDGGAYNTEAYSGAALAPGQQGNFEFTIEMPTGLADGAHILECVVVYPGDELPFNDTLELIFNVQSQAHTAPFEENFNNPVYPQGWSVVNLDDEITWERVFALGPNGQNSRTFYVNHYDYQGSGQEDELVTPYFEIPNTLPELRFDLAKTQFGNNNQDALQVYVSDGCSQTYSLIYDKADQVLATVPYRTQAWTPSNPSEWRNEQIDLSDYAGTTAHFKFVAINGYGNSTFIDNVNMVSSLGLDEKSGIEFNVYPNPSSGEFTIAVNEEVKDALVTVMDQAGRVIGTWSFGDGVSEMKIDLQNAARGIYFLKVESGANSKVTKLLVE